ncbi:MAG: 4Fe-4S dicluster domain-containing protein [Treponema sp.]|nr:4Fe-4S dicluster domain-containing protein [Treponema sp.]
MYSFPRGGILFEDSTVTPISTFHDDSWSVLASFRKIWGSEHPLMNIARKGLNVFKASVVAQSDSVSQTEEQPMLKPASSRGYVDSFLPVLSVIPLTQNNGIKVRRLVELGDTVREGMLVGKGEEVGAANIHASVPGTVVRLVSWEMAEGVMSEGVVIRLGGNFERSGKQEEALPWDYLTSAELRNRVRDCGVVEMEGSGKPVVETLMEFDNGPKPLSLVVSCVFDDPWRVADYVLCQEYFESVVEGSAIISKMCGAEQIVFAVSSREQWLGERFITEIAKYQIPTAIVLVGYRYPQGNRRELELTLRIYEKQENVKLGRLLIQGPATLAAVRDAVVLKKPVLERFVAVGGSAVRNPQVMRARIGKRIREAFNECGGFVREPSRIAEGSPLAGRCIANLDEPISKTTYALFALLPKQVGGRVTRSCIGCGECRLVCPVGLDPEVLFKRIESRAQVAPWVFECHGCGCCNVVCPSRLPLSTLVTNAAILERKRNV